MHNYKTPWSILRRFYMVTSKHTVRTLFDHNHEL